MSLVISYEECLQYVQNELNSFMHGELKPWTERQQLNYSMIVNVKNGRVPRPIPKLVQKIMGVFGFHLEARRIRQEDRFVAEYTLVDADEIKAFCSQSV
ncbi:hypothetical protein [Hymenobacter rubripertinctus]|uniref:Uncharacterized protein n=1 Tax=Hymenobacter rubripertinctus TaxID=2029981 RepID=A0A418R7U2_9BACT|nr:hypothetical protein [Hymenobacter rubripertinctus]RIY13361.1 hypothetical protein D0T11_02700 [Hymenobacter rubripertinctus]